eukprot:m.169201 g.169201  ORF g.169201 m.169201 type:complete len:208 (+) comp14768_c0_seq1:1491-2114(+)
MEGQFPQEGIEEDVCAARWQPTTGAASHECISSSRTRKQMTLLLQKINGEDISRNFWTFYSLIKSAPQPTQEGDTDEAHAYCRRSELIAATTVDIRSWFWHGSTAPHCAVSSVTAPARAPRTTFPAAFDAICARHVPLAPEHAYCGGGWVTGVASVETAEEIAAAIWLTLAWRVAAANSTCCNRAGTFSTAMEDAIAAIALLEAAAF